MMVQQYDDTFKLLMSIKEDVASTKVKIDNIEGRMAKVDTAEAKTEQALDKALEATRQLTGSPKYRIGQLSFW